MAEIISNPDIMGGLPCIAGTRIPVKSIAARIAGGETVREVSTDFGITDGDVLAAVQYVEDHPDLANQNKKKIFR